MYLHGLSHHTERQCSFVIDIQVYMMGYAESQMSSIGLKFWSMEGKGVITVIILVHL